MKNQPMFVDLPPGSVIVVGPNGRFKFDTIKSELVIVGCDFKIAGNMTPEHKALVDQLWATRSEYGLNVKDATIVDIPTWDSDLRGFVAKRPPE